MFLVIALLFVVLGHLMSIAGVVFAVGVVGAIWLIVTRPRPQATVPAVPAQRRPARVAIPRQHGDRDPLPEHRPTR